MQNFLSRQKLPDAPVDSPKCPVFYVEAVSDDKGSLKFWRGIFRTAAANIVLEAPGFAECADVLARHVALYYGSAGI